METLITWYAENGSALWATIIGFFSANLLTIIGLVFGWLRTKAASNKYTASLEATITELENKLTKIVEDNKEDIIKACDANTQKRIAKMQEIADTVKAENEALEPVEITPVDALNSLN